MNIINRINEIFVLSCSYFLLMFSDITVDINLRNKIGYYFIYLMVLVGIFNLVLLFKVIFYNVLRKFREYKFYKSE